MSPSDLSTSITSGQIPILLFENSYPATVPSDEKQNSCLLLIDSNPRTCEFNLSRSTLLIADHDLNGLPFNLSVGLPEDQLDHTCTGIDTFGRPVHRSPRHRLSLCWSSNSAAGDFIRNRDRDLQDQLQDGGEHLYYEDSWIDASQWDHALPPSALSQEDRREDQPEHSSLLEESFYESNLTDNKSPSIQDPILADAQSESYNLITLTTSSTLNSVSSPRRNYSPPSATQGTDLISVQESSRLAY
jgi:hypothetical protein